MMKKEPDTEGALDYSVSVAGGMEWVKPARSTLVTIDIHGRAAVAPRPAGVRYP